jgi:flagellar hook protein FlgE
MSLEIALSGIQAINNQLEAVSNNIANSGTYGFKSSRANFSSVYAGTQASGVEVGSLTQSIGQSGNMTGTGRNLDAAIDGRGFFVSRDSQGGLAYSRVGIFSANQEGKMVDSSGRTVQGYGPAEDGALGTLGTLGDINVATGQIAAKASTKVTFVGNLSNDWVTPTKTPFSTTDAKTYNMAKQSVVYDSLGAQHTLSQYFVRDAGNNVTVQYAFDGDLVPASAHQLKFTSTGQLVVPAPVPPAIKPPPYDPVALEMTTTNGSNNIKVEIDYNGTTFFSGDALTTTNSSDGYASGTFVGLELANDGAVMAKYSNEQKQIVGTLAIATFADEGSLSAVSDTSWVANTASGAALFGSPGVGLAGKLNTSTLEGSNVDITSELVGLMTSQRNYQANSKVISTETAMMQALMQAL